MQYNIFCHQALDHILPSSICGAIAHCGLGIDRIDRALNILLNEISGDLIEGSGNEREIFYVMLDKSTYLKKLA